MKRNLIIVALLFCIVLSSCIKTEVRPAKLKMQVIDAQGYTVYGASVYLYETSNDFYKDVNVVAQGTTDANGYVYFTDLSSRIGYYFYVQDGCQDNFNNVNHLSYTLEPNTVNAIAPIVVSSVGKIVVQSSSAYPYKILVDGQVYLDNLPAMKSATFYEMPAGTHTVKVIQLSGYIGLPNIEIFNNVTVECGATTIVNFP